MRKNNLDPCLPLIEDYFDNSEIKSFSLAKFFDIYGEQYIHWNIPQNKNAYHVIRYLIGKGVLEENSFLNASNIAPRIIYSWKTKDELTVITGLKPLSYYSYFTALYLNQLTYQIPKTIYMNFEHYKSGIEPFKTILNQQAVDNAFKKDQRKSTVSFAYLDKNIIVTNGKFTNRLGVLKQRNDMQCYDYTDIERTLIDISVRPVYAGGVFEVLNAYKLAKGRLDLNKLSDYLERLEFIYPYHQVIGFYLEKAEYSQAEVELFKLEMPIKFYLTYNIRNSEFSNDWNLYYPKGL